MTLAYFCHREKVKKLEEDLAKSEEELSKTNEALKSKNVAVQKLQKIGRSYRMKYEDATKELQELKESTQVWLCAP